MEVYKVTDSELSGIASAIRQKGGTSDPLVFPSEFVSAINNIETQGTYVSKTITENGDYDPASDNADAFSHITVSVPTGSSPVLVSKSISENGTYNPADDNADAYSQVVVNVSGGGGGFPAFILEGTSGTLTDNTVTKVRDSAFYSHGGIEGIELTVCNEVGGYAFTYCTNLTSASFPNCTSIKQSAFYGCINLSNIYAPNLTSISQAAFANCYKLSSVNFPKISELTNNVFRSCGLETVSLPECEAIGGYTFIECKSLKSIYLPKVSMIYDGYTFSGCLMLSDVVLDVCSSLSNNTFMGCTKLEKVVLLYSSVCSIQGSNVFRNTPIGLSSYLGYFGSVYVPASLVESYKTANNWSFYSDRITSYVEG